MRIIIDNVTKAYRTASSEVSVFRDFVLQIADPITAIFGPNGSGKSTLLHLLAGLTPLDAGSVRFEGVKSATQPRFGCVFQGTEGFIFPWLKNIDNVALPLKLKGIPLPSRHAAVLELMEQLDLDIPLDRYPYEISGGQRQILSIMRALIDCDVDVLLLDEPFGGLDYLNTLRMPTNLQAIVRRRGTVTLFVSHTIDEAAFMADCIITLGGRPTRALRRVNVPFRLPRHSDLLVSSEFLGIKEEILSCYRRNLRVRCRPGSSGAT